MSDFSVQSAGHWGMARRGRLSLPHGTVETPFFMPIATRGAVKTISSGDLEALGADIILSNTYHLWLRPGLEVLKAFGGLHRMMDWKKPILTDSGGFQVFSLEGLRKLTDEGVTFQSHIDGAKLELTPETCMEIQRTIGSDIAMVLDVCTKLPATEKELERALSLTTQWARRSKTAWEALKQGSVTPDAKLFAIVQGGTDIEKRKRSATELIEIGFDGYAVGGLSVGEPHEEACQVLDALHPILPADRPRYFMGGAQPHEIVEYVKRGIDMFDCVLPTRNARHGLLYRFVHDDLDRPDFYETVHVTNEKFKTSQEPLRSPGREDPSVSPLRKGGTDVERPLLTKEGPGEVLPELSRYTLGYVRHLFSVNEMLGQRLVTLANLQFYLELMRRIRERAA